MTRRELLVAIAVLPGCSGRPDPVEVAPAASEPAAPITPTPTAVAPGSEEEFLTTLLVEQLAVDRSKIDMNRPIGEPPVGADELDLVEIVMELEEQFEVAIPDEDLEKVAGGKGDDLTKRITPAQLVALTKQARERAAGKSK